MYTLGGKKFAHATIKKPLQQKPRGADPLKLRLDQSRIFDPESSDHPEDASDEENHPAISNGVGKRVFGSISNINNESLRKKVFRGDIDRNSAFYDLIRAPYTPRTIGLKLELFKSI